MSKKKIYDAYVSDEPTSREETLKAIREIIPMNDDKRIAEWLKRQTDQDKRRLKERIFLLDHEDIDNLLTIWIYESGHYTDHLIKKENICEICQLILDYDSLLGNDLNG